MTLKEIGTLIRIAQTEAAELMLQARNITGQTKSGPRDIVTEYDRRVQEFLTATFAAALPEAEFFCEENAENGDPMAAQLFIIDPIDGTMNFARGLNHSCISVAYAEHGQVLVGAVYNPYLKEHFYAEKGQGAFLNGRPIRTADTPLEENVAAIGTAPYRKELYDETFRKTRLLFEHCLDIRRQGAAALDLCDVAAGRMGLFMELSLCWWDYAAGALIVEEAGGVCRTERGEALPVGSTRPSVLAGGKRCVEEYLRLTAPERSEK